MIRSLFVEDAAAGLALPGISFDAVRYEPRKADKTGAVTVDGNTYLVGPAFAGRLVTIGLRHDVVELIDEHAHPVVTFERVFGTTTTTQLHASQLLPALATKPGAWSHSPARPFMPELLRDWLDQATMSERASTFHHLGRVSEVTSFDTAMTAATRLITLGDMPAGTGLEMLARRLWQGSEPEPQPVNLALYDQLRDGQHQQAVNVPGSIDPMTTDAVDAVDERLAPNDMGVLNGLCVDGLTDHRSESRSALIRPGFSSDPFVRHPVSDGSFSCSA